MVYEQKEIRRLKFKAWQCLILSQLFFTNDDDDDDDDDEVFLPLLKLLDTINTPEMT